LKDKKRKDTQSRKEEKEERNGSSARSRTESLSAEKKRAEQHGVIEKEKGKRELMHFQLRERLSGKTQGLIKKSMEKGEEKIQSLGGS